LVCCYNNIYIYDSLYLYKRKRETFFNEVKWWD
jgi:hypothetical protein